MRSTDLLVAGLCLVLSTDALRVEKRDDPSVLKIDLQKKAPELLARSARKRQTVETPDVNYQKQLLYIIQLEIGTPPQSTFVQLDTGSSDLIVETDSSDICSTAPPNPVSSTYQYFDSNFQVAYGGGDGATGDWCSDIVSIGGATLQGTQFGVMYKSTVLEGILGVSYPIIEGRQTFSGEPEYPNFPVLLVQQGYIASRAFSLWTNDDQSTGGTLLFGGIDTSKFSGELVTIDLVASGFDGFPGVVDFTLALNSVTGTDSSGNPVAFTDGTTPINVLMDSGTTITMLPQALVTEIWNFVGATPYSNDPTSAYIPCSAGSNTETINLAFNGITINVPLSQLVIFPDSTNTLCSFGIEASTSYIIGDTVLTAMYAVYDLDNNQLSLAPTVFNSTAPENILQIMAGPGGVPDTFHSSSSVGTSSTTSSSVSSSASSSSASNTPSSSTTSSVISSSSSSSSTGVSSSSSILSSSSSVLSSSSASSVVPSTSITSSTLFTSTTKPATSTSIAKPLKCNKDNCLLAIQHASATAFCAAYQAGIPTPTPTAIAKGCQTLSSRISSGCACLGTATVSTLASSTSSIILTSSSSSTKVSSTSNHISSTSIVTSSPKALNCNMNNCLRAVEKSTATDFCSAYVTGAPVAVPTNILKGCATSASRALAFT
ncbi:uncharacterized protein PAC_06783 [Phialocephala subalpina]|uniref:Peptidase A1 domain-containing protein n=1 Tax=Phialocephala subalpina TaxID=576137 RepID=A0A1L7WVW9_9HELO|nr:uncharacterized protein PAC_06783 [Phialocephala subalpina]